MPPTKNSGQADGTLRNPPTREADPGLPTNGRAAAVTVVPRRGIGSTRHPHQTTDGATRSSLSTSARGVIGVQAAQGTTTGMEGRTGIEVREVHVCPGVLRMCFPVRVFQERL